MAATIAATVVAADPVAHVQLDVTMDDPAGVLGWSITRSVPGESLLIYVGAAGQSSMSVVDYTCPLGATVTYTLSVSRSTTNDYATATAAIVGTTGCFLTSPARGFTVAVEISEWPSRKRAARQAILDVLGRADPVGLTDAYATPAGQWTLISRTDAYTADLMLALTGDGGVAVLRTQPGSSIASVTVLVGDIDERRFSTQGGDQRRLVDVAIQEIQPLPAQALPLAATLGGLAVYNGITTLTGLNLLRPTLLQLSQIETG